jgi:hypothetical protein
MVEWWNDGMPKALSEVEGLECLVLPPFLLSSSLSPSLSFVRFVPSW